MDEIWVSVYGHENRFMVSNMGRLKSINGKYKKKYIDGFITEGTIDTLGYRVVTLRNSERKTTKMVRLHTLVAKYFCKKKEGVDVLWVNHIDGNKLNNHYSNLEWITPKENCEHAVKKGLFNLKGEKHPNSKLKEADILTIRELYKSGMIHKDIAHAFGVSRRQIGDIINGKNWGWL